MSAYSIAPSAIPQADIASGNTWLTREASRKRRTLPNRLYWSVAGRARLRTNLDGMRTTLEKIKAVAERG
jgi:hypothetical protein